MRVPVAAVSLAAVLAGSPAMAADKGPSLQEVLQRAAAYVARFERAFAGIVAEEHYVQDAQPPSRKQSNCGPTKGAGCSDSPATPQHVDLRSYLLLVNPGGRGGWTQYRDVFQVNGEPVRDRSERLSALFRSPSASSSEQLARIIDESARYNIGDVMRNINTPLFALQALRADMQWRFRFSRSTRPAAPATVASEPAVPGEFRVSTEVWTVEFRERETPTWIRTPANENIRARGRFWIEPDSGRVLMSELVADHRTLHAIIDVSYQSEPVLGMLVPIEMRERYDGRASGSRTDARATYGTFVPIGNKDTVNLLKE
jgi:hypothetical protein